MSRYIDADKLTSVIKPMCGEFTDNDFMINYQRVLSIIDSAPTIEVDRPQGEWHNGFYDFLWNVINPNEMQKYIEIYEAQPIAVDEAQMKGTDDDWTTQACIEMGR